MALGGRQIREPCTLFRTSKVVLAVKNLFANAEDVRDMSSIPGWEDPLEKGMATHSSILAWRIPWTESLAGYGPRGRKESDTTKQLKQ